MQHGGWYMGHPGLDIKEFLDQEARKEEAIQQYPHWGSIATRMNALSTLSLEDLYKLTRDFIDLQKWVSVECNISPFGCVASDDFERIVIGLKRAKTQFLMENVPDCYHYEELSPHQLFAQKEVVLGYVCTQVNVSFEIFIDLTKRWHTPEKYISDDSFLAQLDEYCCTVWNTMDDHGCFSSGYWKYPEGSEERENAYTLQRQFNLKKLCLLPYPREAILYAIQLGCSSRYESVRSVVNLCEWYVRKKSLLKRVSIHWAIHNLCKHTRSAVVLFLWVAREKQLPPGVRRFIVQHIVQNNIPCLACADKYIK